MKAAIGAKVRDWLGIHPQSDVSPLAQQSWIGSDTHGYSVPDGLLGPDSVCYTVGAGDDITFDTELARRFGCRVCVIDPTPEGKRHFEEVGDHVRRGAALASRNGKPFAYQIGPERWPLLRYLEIGVWDEPTQLRFYEPTKKGYISHSITMFQESGRYIELPVDRLANIMKSQGHSQIDLLKLEIEGAEYRVLETVVEDRLDIKCIVVEYDEVWHRKGRAHLFRIRDSSRRLLAAGYRLVHSTSMFKRSFLREDVYRRLSGGSGALGRS